MNNGYYSINRLFKYIIQNKKQFCYLKKIRISRNLSQNDLAIYSTYQFEQFNRKKDINKVFVRYVCRLTKALGCDIKDLT